MNPARIDVHVDVFDPASLTQNVGTVHYRGVTNPADDYLRDDVVLGAMASTRAAIARGAYGRTDLEVAVRFVEIDGAPESFYSTTTTDYYSSEGKGS